MMKKCCTALVLLIILVSPTITQAQVKVPPVPRDELQVVYASIQKYSKYPSEAKHNCEQGKVLIGLIVRKNGEIDSIQVINDAPASLERAALKAFKKAKIKWIPGKGIDNYPVDAFTVFPINFETRLNCPKIEKLKADAEKAVKEQNYVEALPLYNQYLQHYFSDLGALAARAEIYQKVGNLYAACKDWNIASYLRDNQASKLYQENCIP